MDITEKLKVKVKKENSERDKEEEAVLVQIKSVYNAITTVKDRFQANTSLVSEVEKANKEITIWKYKATGFDGHSADRHLYFSAQKNKMVLSDGPTGCIILLPGLFETSQINSFGDFQEYINDKLHNEDCILLDGLPNINKTQKNEPCGYNTLFRYYGTPKKVEIAIGVLNDLQKD